MSIYDRYGFSCVNSVYAPKNILNENPVHDYKCGKKHCSGQCAYVLDCKFYVEQEWIKDYADGKEIV